MNPLLTALIPLSLAIGSLSVRAAVFEADICVFGGTSSGVTAAVQAARMGKTVILAEPGKHLGGMTSGGLSAVDIGDPRSVGGIAREYFTRLAATDVVRRKKTPAHRRQSLAFSHQLLPLPGDGTLPLFVHRRNTDHTERFFVSTFIPIQTLA
jgi:choline dehydrogenase-like flavoprotein